MKVGACLLKPPTSDRSQLLNLQCKAEENMCLSSHGCMAAHEAAECVFGHHSSSSKRGISYLHIQISQTLKDIDTVSLKAGKLFC
jgi:hypothetical protein